MQKQLIFFISVFSQLYSFLIFFRIILSWIPTRPNNLTRFVSDVTDPFLQLCRKILPPIAMIDFSPILALFAVDLISYFLISLLTSI